MSDTANLIYTSLIEKYNTSTVTKKQTASELQIGQTKLDYLRKQGAIKFIKVGSQIRFRLTDLAEYIGDAS